MIVYKHRNNDININVNNNLNIINYNSSIYSICGSNCGSTSCSSSCIISSSIISKYLIIFPFLIMMLVAAVSRMFIVPLFLFADITLVTRCDWLDLSISVCPLFPCMSLNGDRLSRKILPYPHSFVIA